MPANNTSTADELIQKIKQLCEEHYSKLSSEHIKAVLKNKKESEVKYDM